MKKKLNTDVIANELEGASLFFTKRPSTPPVPQLEKPPQEKAANPLSASPFFEKTSKSPPVETVTEKASVKPKKVKIEKENNRDTTIPRNHDTTVSRYQDTTTPRIHGVAIEMIRKAVKVFGKEAATHRFTEAEKMEIGDLIYTYKNRGFDTSENEITRIAINFVINDYRENGENSVLHKILEALNE